jgi:hypothetical protein
MTDILEEDKNLTVRDIIFRLREKYNNEFHTPSVMDIDERQICTALAIRWPGNEMVKQIIKDTIKMLIESKIDLTTIQ